MREFAFRPRPQAGPQHWALKDGQLARRGGASALSIGEVAAVEWTDMAYRGTRVRSLRLKAGYETTTLECTDNGEGDDSQRFLQLCLAVAQHLPADVFVRLETSALARLMFWRAPKGLRGPGFVQLLRGMTAPMDGPDYDT